MSVSRVLGTVLGMLVAFLVLANLPAYAAVSTINAYHGSDPLYTDNLIFDVNSDSPSVICLYSLYEDIYGQLLSNHPMPLSTAQPANGFAVNYTRPATGTVTIECDGVSVTQTYSVPAGVMGGMLNLIYTAPTPTPSPTGTPISTPVGTSIAPVVTEEVSPVLVFDVFKLACPDVPISWVSGDETATLTAIYLNGSVEQIGPVLTLIDDGTGHGFTVSAILVAGTSFPAGTEFEIRTDRELLAVFTLEQPVTAHYQGTLLTVREGCGELEG